MNELIEQSRNNGSELLTSRSLKEIIKWVCEASVNWICYGIFYFYWIFNFYFLLEILFLLDFNTNLILPSVEFRTGKEIAATREPKICDIDVSLWGKKDSDSRSCKAGDPCHTIPKHLT